MILHYLKKYSLLLSVLFLFLISNKSFAQVDIQDASHFKGFEFSKTHELLSRYHSSNNNSQNSTVTPISGNPARDKVLGIKPQGANTNPMSRSVGYEFQTNPYGGMNIPSASTIDTNGNLYITGGSSNEETPEGNFVTIKVNSQGTKVWEARQPGTPYAAEFGMAIAQDSDANPVSTGIYWNGNDMDVQTVKYDADTGAIIWQATYDGGDEGLDVPTTITTDDSGNTYVAGITYRINTVAYLTLKYDINGSLVWATRDVNPINESWNEPSAIAVDDNGNVLVTGYGSNADFWQGYYTIKYNSAGSEQWSRLYNYLNDTNENTNSVARDIAFDAAGNSYITGTFDTFNETMGTIKYTSDGTQEWIRTYKYDTDFTNAYAIEVVDNSTIYVGGNHNGGYVDDGIVLISYQTDGTQNWIQQTENLLNNTSAFLTLDGNGLPVIGSMGYDEISDVYVRSYKFDTDGSQLEEASYSKAYSPVESIRQFIGFGIDATDNLYLTFDSFFTAEGGIFQYTKVPFSSGDNNPEWTEIFSNDGGSVSQMLNAVADGSNVYVTSTFGTIVNGEYVSNKSLVKYNENGEVAWSKIYYGSNDGLGPDFGISVQVDSSGNPVVYLIPSSFSFEPEPSRLIKYDADGDLIWQTDSYFTSPQMYTFFLDASDNVYIAGSSYENEADTTSKFTTAKFSSVGDNIWTQYTSSTNSSNNIYSINAGTVDSNGNVILIGALGTGGFFSQTIDLAILSYSSAGSLLDLNAFHINDHNTSGTNLLLDDSGNLYVNGTQQHQTTYEEQLLLVKFDTDLQHQWTSTYAENGRRVRSYEMKQNSLGNIIVSGFSNSLEDNKVILANYDTDGNEVWVYDTNINNFYVDFYIDDADTIYLYNQVLTTTFPNRLYYSTGPLPLGGLFKINTGGNNIENESFVGPELSVFFPTVMTALQNGTLLLGGTLNNELSYYEGLYFFESTHTVLGIDEHETPVNSQNWLGQNYPNPSIINTTIPFYLKEGGHVQISLYDITGRKVYDVMDTNLSSGQNQIDINTSNLTSGIYFYQLKCGNYKEARKMIIQ